MEVPSSEDVTFLFLHLGLLWLFFNYFLRCYRCVCVCVLCWLVSCDMQCCSGLVLLDCCCDQGIISHSNCVYQLWYSNSPLSMCSLTTDSVIHGYMIVHEFINCGAVTH